MRQLADLRNLLRSNDQVKILAISVDSATETNALIKKVEADGKGDLSYTFLSDPNSKTIDAYGLRDERYRGRSSYGIPKPSFFLVTKERRIKWFAIDDDYRRRTPNETIRKELDRPAENADSESEQ